MRDVTFNKDEFYNGNLNSFKDNLFNVIKEEIDEFICIYKIYNDKAILINLLN